MLKSSRNLLLLFVLVPLQLAAKGCDVATVGEDMPAQQDCGGLAGLTCADGEYCDYAEEALCGAADATGVCKPTPEVCTDEFAPVCGCNGVTYANACTASSAGVSVSSSGECEPSGDGTCGGLLGRACPAGEFCDFALDAVCGAADATGVCTPEPEGCDDVYDPVCGCDDTPYSNACEANAAGVSVAYFGMCNVDPAGGCGGLLGSTCADSEFCYFGVDAFCGGADGSGTCTAKPQACDAVYEPVCGCNIMTYGNECEAHRAGVLVAALGACGASPPPEGTTCGGLAGAGCPAGQYCNYAEAALCGAADATGLCAEIAAGCTKELAPVCGCDGETYSNACMAAAAGVSVSSQGECP